MNHPNVVFVFADQWRAQACGYAGDPCVQTPNLDALAGESVNVANAIASCPVCSPYRASLLTGQYPLTHGIFLNDAPLGDRAVSIAQAFGRGGYQTAYIGKWHVDGHGRDAYIPPERRQGFGYWKARECTHRYNESMYYAGDSDEPLIWDGYDAIAQTRDAQAYIRDHAASGPFLLMLSWGPPHAPLHTAPPDFKTLYDPADIQLRPNVPEGMAEQAREWLAGYYAHCSALDACVGDLLGTLAATGIADNTMFVFTSDHGDMLGSQGEQKKQRPWVESVRVPFLLRCPDRLGPAPRRVSGFLDAPDIMPTLLGLAGLSVPHTVEGRDFSGHLAGGPDPSGGEGLVACYHPFGQFTRDKGGREYRGLLTERHAYVRSLEGPWLLYDHETDPYEAENRVHDPAFRDVQEDLDRRLWARLDDLGDAFEPGDAYVERWGYEVDERGTISISTYTG